MNDKNDIGSKIRTLRKRIGVSQWQFAELADISPDALGKIERGDCSPSIATLRNIAKGLNITLHDIVCDDAEDSKLFCESSSLVNFNAYLNSKQSHEIEKLHKIALIIMEDNGSTKAEKKR